VRHALNNICNLDGSYIMEGHDLDLAKSMMEGNQRVRRVYSPEVRHTAWQLARMAIESRIW
jgi:hypothetical protein